MTYFRYDKTFEGLLSAIFTAYSLKCFPDKLLGSDEPVPAGTGQQDLFHTSGLSGNTIITVATSTSEADRVWNGLKKHLSPSAMQSISTVWLSELPEIDELIFRYIRKAFDYRPGHLPVVPDKQAARTGSESTGATSGSIELNFADPDVLQMSRIWKKVSNERLRIIQFVRFLKAADGTYFALIEPQYNVLSITLSYFTDRFHDQEWIIYDLRRSYGYYYNKKSVQEITFQHPPEFLSDDLTADGEELYSKLWKTYFNAVCIKERINPGLHKRNLPRRFWKHLTEKK